LHTGLISLGSVAENIITCLSCGVILKIFWMVPLMSLRISPEMAFGFLTEFADKLVALIHDEELQVLEVERLPRGQIEDPTRGPDNDVWWVVLQGLHVGPDGLSSVEDASLDVLEVLTQASELLVDLVGELARVGEDEARDGLGVLEVDSLEDCQDEDCRLAHTRLGLAEDVAPENRFRDALLLNLGWMLESCVNDSPLDLRLEEEVLEARRMYTDICTK